MKLGRITHNKRGGSRGEAVILFSAGGNNFAIAAQAVEEIRDAAGVQPFAHGIAGAQNVQSLLAREENTYFVVHLSQHFGGPAAAPPHRLLLLREGPLALGAARIDRMAEIAVLHPLPRAFRGAERKWYRGLALVGEEVVPVIEPSAILSSDQLLALSAAVPVASESDPGARREKQAEQTATRQLEAAQ